MSVSESEDFCKKHYETPKRWIPFRDSALCLFSQNTVVSLFSKHIKSTPLKYVWGEETTNSVFASRQ